MSNYELRTIDKYKYEAPRDDTTTSSRYWGSYTYKGSRMIHVRHTINRNTEVMNHNTTYLLTYPKRTRLKKSCHFDNTYCDITVYIL